MIHQVGTEVERKGGRIWVKIPGKIVLKGRYLYMKKHEVKEGDRVFFKDGDCHNFDPRNLVAINFQGPRYHCEKSRVIFRPHKLPR